MAIYQSSFVPLFTMGMAKAGINDKDEQLQKITLSMISLGLGEAAGSVVNGTL